jgi:Fur family ferric uptake transcriptional regulator
VTATQTAWLEHALDELRGAGHRSGGARTAVVELLAEQDCCLTAQEIFDQLRARDRRVGIASVYRALDLLTSMKLVQRLEMGEGTARYEPAHADGEHHHHVVCERCGKVAAFEDDELEDALEGLAGKLGYALGGHDVVLRGECPACRER